MSRHRLNEDDHTTILPATVEQLAAQERESRREPSARSRRPVVIVAAATVALTAAATGWALARPAGQAPAAPLAWTTAGGERSYDDGFGQASPSAEPSVVPLPRDPGPRPAATTAGPTPSATSPSTLVGATPTPAALVVGGRRSLRAAALPDRYVRQHSGLASLADVTAGSAGEVRQAATFTVVAGLADASCFSFAGADGNYLRHRDYRIRHERHDGSQLFRADATFCIRQGGLPGSIYLESYNYRDHYVHLRGDELWIDRWRDGGEFRQECSFAVTAAWS